MRGVLFTVFEDYSLEVSLYYLTLRLHQRTGVSSGRSDEGRQHPRQASHCCAIKHSDWNAEACGNDKSCGGLLLAIMVSSIDTRFVIL